ncbi:MAG: hypothetical protein IPJ85_15095 [Flavobacteriales bacterium]|nr:hypothetical protein [Flavobacteriales bacterium]
MGSHVQPQVRDRRWPGTLMAIGVFVGLLSALTVVPWTLIEHGLLLRFFIGLCFVGNLLPYARSGLRMGMERLEWFLFNLLAIGPLVTCSLLWANFIFHGPVVSGTHAVVTIDDHGTYLTYNFSDDYLAEHWMARSNYRDWPDAHGRRLNVSTATGLLGFEVVVKKVRATD